MKQIVLLVYVVTIGSTIFAQKNNCALELLRNSNNVYLVDAEEVLCLAMNSNDKYSLFYTFAIWCEPCIKDFPDVLHFAAEEKIPLYVIIKDKEADFFTTQAIDYLKGTETKWQTAFGEDLKIHTLVLKDDDGRPNKKYKKFLTKITPKNFEVIDSMSKLLLINNEGKVLMVTSYKDNQGKGKSEMIQRLIKPLLIK